jgi:hypothetical protein
MSFLQFYNFIRVDSFYDRYPGLESVVAMLLWDNLAACSEQAPARVLDYRTCGSIVGSNFEPTLC